LRALKRSSEIPGLIGMATSRVENAANVPDAGRKESVKKDMELSGLKEEDVQDWNKCR